MAVLKRADDPACTSRRRADGKTIGSETLPPVGCSCFSMGASIVCLRSDFTFLHLRRIFAIERPDCSGQSVFSSIRPSAADEPNEASNMATARGTPRIVRFPFSTDQQREWKRSGASGGPSTARIASAKAYKQRRFCATARLLRRSLPLTIEALLRAS